MLSTSEIKCLTFVFLVSYLIPAEKILYPRDVRGVSEEYLPVTFTDSAASPSAGSTERTASFSLTIIVGAGESEWNTRLWLS